MLMQDESSASITATRALLVGHESRPALKTDRCQDTEEAMLGRTPTHCQVDWLVALEERTRNK